MADVIDQIDKNVGSKWLTGFLTGLVLGFVLFYGSLKFFPVWFEKVLKEDYVPRKEYELKTQQEHDSKSEPKSPMKNYNNQNGNNIKNTQQ